MAHELGHVVLHPDLWKQVKTVEDAIRIQAGRYVVSVQAMKIRLQNLGWEKLIMHSFKENKKFLGPEV